MHDRSAPRRRHTAELKTRVLAACNEPGASVAAVAHAHDLNANLVHKWRRSSPPARLAAAACSADPVAASRFIALAMPAPQAAPAPADIRIELRRGAATVAVSWPVAGADACAAWLSTWLR